MDWQWISIVADVLGVGMDSITFLDKFVKSGKESDPLKLLCIMHGTASATIVSILRERI